MTTQWCDRLAPLEATIRCGTAQHRLRWAAGRLVVCDHDLAAEEALAALGGPLPACVQVVWAVRRHLAHVAPLTLWAVDADPTALTQVPADGLRGTGRPATGTSMEDERLLDALRALPLPFRRRLAVAFHVGWARRGTAIASWESHPAGALLGTALRTAFTDALRHAGGAGTAPATLELRWQTVGAAIRPHADGAAGPHGAWVRAQVPLSWLAEVWAAGDAVDGDTVVLARGRRLGAAAPRLAVRWRFDPVNGRATLERAEVTRPSDAPTRDAQERGGVPATVVR